MRSAARLLALLALGFACPAIAEVRLVREGGATSPLVTVREGLGGPWTGQGCIDRSVLNPSGDLAGDGRPAVLVNSGTALVAWHDRATQGLRLAMADRGWRELVRIHGQTDPGEPLLARFGTGYVVAWQPLEAPQTRLAFVTSAGDVLLSDVSIEGEPMALAVLGSSLCVFVGDNSTGSLDLVLLGAADRPMPMPRPPGLVFRQRLALADGVRTVPTPEEEPTPFLRLSVQRIVDGAPWPDSASTWSSEHNGRRGAEVGVGLVDAGHGDTSIPVALWWRDPQTLEFVELYEDGVGDVRQVTGRGEYSPSLVREALRLAAEE